MEPEARSAVDQEDLKLADRAEWRFDLAYLDPERPNCPTHVLAGIWEHPTGYLAWTMHELTHIPGCAIEPGVDLGLSYATTD